MTIKGLLSRVKMIPHVVGIALRSFQLGVYAKQRRFKKYDGAFEDILSTLDPNRELTVTEEEAYTLFSSIKAVTNVKGAIAEFGVYQGASARIICEVKESKPIYLFDTFEGMPNEKITDKDRWRADTHKDTDQASVSHYLQEFDNKTFVPGIFPESVMNRPDLDQVRYSFVHLDVDLYESTIAALTYFFPKIVPGGRLVSHNYNLKDTDGGNTPGVKRAFDEFFSHCSSIVIEIAETQCIVIKS